jgi:type III secretory pathway component EscU
MITNEQTSSGDLFDSDRSTQLEIYGIMTRKTRKSLFSIAAVIFVSDLLSLAIANLIVLQTMLVIMIIPALIVALGFLAAKEPLVSMILAAIIVLAVWVYSIVLLGAQAALMGWLIKAIVVYLIIAGFGHATEAARIKKELRL